jgi:proteasome activator subunit 4
MSISHVLEHSSLTHLQSLLASQYFMLTFLPLSHPQSYLPMLFQIWESVNSYMYDERMLQFLARLAEMHVDPTASDPRKIKDLPDDAVSDDEGRPQWPNEDLQFNGTYWGGLYKDVGIFTEYDWGFLMSKCLASMGQFTGVATFVDSPSRATEIQLADSGSLHTGSSADSQATFEVDRLPKPSWRICESHPGVSHAQS